MTDKYITATEAKVRAENDSCLIVAAEIMKKINCETLNPLVKRINIELINNKKVVCVIPVNL